MPGLLTNLIEQKVEKSHRDEEDRKQRLRQFYYDRIHDETTPPEVREQLSQDYFKLLSPDAKKSAQKGMGLIGKLKQAFGGQKPQQPQQGQPQPAQPTQLSKPLSAPPQAQQAQPQAQTVNGTPDQLPPGYKPPHADPKTPQEATENGQALDAAQKSWKAGGLQGAGTTPQPAQPQPSPKGTLPAPAAAQPPRGQRPASKPLSAPPSLPEHMFRTDEEIQQLRDTADAKKMENEKAMDEFKKKLEVRAKDEEDLNKRKHDLEEEKARDGKFMEFVKTLPPDKQAAEIQRYTEVHAGLKEEKPATAEKKTNIHVKLKGGDWVPAEESPDGKITTLDGKPVDPSTIEDVNKTGAPPPPKYTGELGERVNAQKVVDDSKIPDSAPEKKAARATLKSLDQKAKAVDIKITNQSQQQATSTLSSEDLRALAQRQILTGEKPSFGLGKSKDRDAYNRALAEELRNDPDSASARAAYKAGSANLGQLAKVRGQVGAFEDAFQADLKNAETAAANVPRGSSKKFNSWVQLAQANLEDDPELAAFRVATQTAVNQYARLMFSATGGGTSTDSAREHAEGLLNTAMGKGSYGAALKQMQLEVKNRTAGLDKEIDEQKKNLGKPSPKGTLNAPGGKVKMRAPNGQENEVDASQVEHYKALGATVVK
jgi:hypothetical protein